MTTVFQTPQQVSRISNFYQVGNGQALNCSSSSANVALATLPTTSAGTASTDILIYNAGTVNVFVTFGTSAPTATIPTDGTPANGFICAPGAYLTICKGSNTFIAGITASSTATIYFYQGYGS